MAATGYSKELRERAVQVFLMKGSRSARDESREFGVSHSTLYEWVSVAVFETNDAALAETPDTWASSSENACPNGL